MKIKYTWEYLCEAYKASTITDDEIVVMLAMKDKSPLKKRQFDELINFKETIKEALFLNSFDTNKALKKLKEKLNFKST